MVVSSSVGILTWSSRINSDWQINLNKLAKHKFNVEGWCWTEKAKHLAPPPQPPGHPRPQDAGHLRPQQEQGRHWPNHIHGVMDQIFVQLFWSGVGFFKYQNLMYPCIYRFYSLHSTYDPEDPLFIISAPCCDLFALICHQRFWLWCFNLLVGERTK